MTAPLVVQAKAGTSTPASAPTLNEAPAFAGVTER